MTNVQERLEALEGALQDLQRQQRGLTRQVGLWRGAVLLLLLLGAVALTQRAGVAQAEVLPWSKILTFFSHVETANGGRDLVFTGANLWIVNGQNDTDTVNGLGNLIVGYNELRTFTGAINTRTGSHNVIVGKEHNFSASGGLVAGMRNEIRGDFSSVSGGFLNTASGTNASVSGGGFNEASGDFSSVSGGYQNKASGGGASIGGGYQNNATGDYSSISGGERSTASGRFSSVSGGVFNQAIGEDSAVSGGNYNWAHGDFSSVSGGLGRVVDQNGNWRAGLLFQQN